MQAAVQRLDALEMRAHKLDRRELAPADESSRFGDRKVMERNGHYGFTCPLYQS
jgi:hypothetical protein